MEPEDSIKVNVRSMEERNESFELHSSDRVQQLRQLASERFRKLFVLLLIGRYRH